MGLAFSIAAAAFAAMLALSAWAAGKLPAEGAVPVHFNLRGEPDRFGSRWITLGIMPALFLPSVALILWLASAAPSGSLERLTTGMGIAAVTFVVAHGVVIALLMRWMVRR